MIDKPTVGSRIVVSQPTHEGDSTTTWHDVTVIETATIEDGYAVKVTYPGKLITRRFQKSYRETCIAWLSDQRVIGYVDDDVDQIKQLENMIKI
jgi:FKBP-type peptidyl-prolyl cis-trans isomerase